MRGGGGVRLSAACKFFRMSCLLAREMSLQCRQGSHRNWERIFHDSGCSGLVVGFFHDHVNPGRVLLGANREWRDSLLTGNK